MKKNLILFIFTTFGTMLYGQGLEPATPIQNILNAARSITINGKNLKFEFGGNRWIAKDNGINYLAGVIESDIDNNDDSGVLTLRQTHIWQIEESNTAVVTEQPTGKAAEKAARKAARKADRKAAGKAVGKAGGKVGGKIAGRAVGIAASHIPIVGGIASVIVEKVVEKGTEALVDDAVEAASRNRAKWVESTGTVIVLEYNAGPPVTLSAR